MDGSRVRIFSHSPKKYNVMKISPPIDLKIQSWVKPIMYNDVKVSDPLLVNTAYSYKKRKSFNFLNRSNKPNSPLILCESNSTGKNNNKFVGRKELFNQNSNYYILGKNDLGYEAFPVFDWYHFSRGVNFRYSKLLSPILIVDFCLFYWLICDSRKCSEIIGFIHFDVCTNTCVTTTRNTDNSQHLTHHEIRCRADCSILEIHGYRLLLLGTSIDVSSYCM